ncbi:MAG: alanine racemase [Altibacter sp.]|uniref:alanine racemase n=1 Tax=Altibacter sp. TaxID=2024823 RepID=UPI001E095C95|nr:alanine racemase [Altibacter sp.]MBZ0326352.1 alanine racemase [Altibacter sp.]
MPKANETLLEIDLNALGDNYKYLTSKIKKNTKVMAVVKAFGYGSDAVAVAKELVHCGVTYFAVAYAGEGATLRNAGIQIPILVLHPLPTNFDLIVNSCLEPSIYSRKMLHDFIAYAEAKSQKEYPIHLKINTGLNRLGFKSEDISFIAEMLAETKSVKVRSVFSHLAASEDAAQREFTLRQIEAFRSISTTLTNALGYQTLLHTVNTSGIINFPEAQFDMVRTGIGLYGFGNDPRENQFLKPVATLKTVISQIHTIEAGENVGYNMGFNAKSRTRTATLPIGHADGISRAFGKGVGWVTIHGKKAPIVGNVCMDMIMVDVTNIDCEEGDEVEVFGENPTAEELALAIQSIPYELLTAVSQRIKRVICRK